MRKQLSGNPQDPDYLRIRDLKVPSEVLIRCLH